MKNKIIVFAPHPDDETLGCGGTIIKKLNEGYAVFIVILTDGRNAFSLILGVDSDPTPEELKDIRVNEVKEAAKVLGVPERNLFFLNFEDGTLEKNKVAALKDVVKIFKQVNPIETYCTYERDANPDHLEANRIVKKAINKLNLTTTLYTYSIMQKYGSVGPIIDRLVSIFKRNIVSVDISDSLEKKKRAIYEHKSQTSVISKKQKRPIYNKERIMRHINNTEIFYLNKISGKREDIEDECG